MAATELQAIVRFRFHDGDVEEFKRLSAQCMEIVRTQDTGTLQYDTYFNDDETECIVIERFRDSDALIRHGENLAHLMEAIIATGSVSGELLGEPRRSCGRESPPAGRCSSSSPGRRCSEPTDARHGFVLLHDRSVGGAFVVLTFVAAPRSSAAAAPNICRSALVESAAVTQTSGHSRVLRRCVRPDSLGAGPPEGGAAGIPPPAIPPGAGRRRTDDTRLFLLGGTAECVRSHAAPSPCDLRRRPGCALGVPLHDVVDGVRLARRLFVIVSWRDPPSPARRIAGGTDNEGALRTV